MARLRIPYRNTQSAGTRESRRALEQIDRNFAEVEKQVALVRSERDVLLEALPKGHLAGKYTFGDGGSFVTGTITAGELTTIPWEAGRAYDIKWKCVWRGTAVDTIWNASLEVDQGAGYVVLDDTRHVSSVTTTGASSDTAMVVTPFYPSSDDSGGRVRVRCNRVSAAGAIDLNKYELWIIDTGIAP